ncbi:MAG: hypothetical protein A2268_11555 [Candidatus Raymondbacteria bacterium RifOxyA12_full_50_37]|uniref:Intracellular septation protein A n=1 Tax=Candidatus Raymondbacteria bacterium RIFOXYD12_FULL_49_13 TaxID=1817890 RepID=A0A1F7FAR0_UNCRA|nr:MAG: hypothetical protein A2268_11555 [Candidatus Raymondbacteria bacterium RifOxyA12_full_50_37]OGJ92404.1 MAG: hypothetical protein A2248_10680 [Candidatus Raymondbacteria bacterium RIFOXYA2_FULL_49_16]OGJ99385.1 MAG: hypothetical protein A2453_13745 [Candidatus Raymondbacteria bacterium RIFOXYC2_FULL_50_21]OGK03602.1 MAG: hypothetical protein A2519_02380 [Candidatus Raymondbacteria bacterium RIFOXYD12_FULL_49_13]OGP44297.1 MAG: hypothetical protein A2324_05070 [Candidatus Raymondbacteria 
MDIRNLIKNLVLSFIPLLVFIVADDLLSDRYGPEQGLKYALIIAVFMGLLQAVYVFAREKRFDKMILLDTGLIIVLGAVSFISGNELFFKLKPALIEFIMVLMLGMVAFVNPRILLVMLGRFTKGMAMNDAQVTLMRRMAGGMFFLFLFHTGAIIYASLYMSHKAWAFISGGLFYILLGGYFVFSVVMARLKQRRLVRQYMGGEKMVELRDEKGRLVGTMPESVIRKNPKIFRK